ncbi:g8572 [Coccomyxa elongata]
MAAVEVTQAQRDQVRAALTKVVEADEVDYFHNEALDELWRRLFGVAAAFQKATQETLLSVLEPGLVGFLKPNAGGETNLIQCVRIALREDRDQQKAGAAKPKAFSKASSGDADALLSELNLIEVDGNVMEPIAVPPGHPVGAEFDYSCYPTEDAGTPTFMDHHKQQLTDFGVKFGRGEYEAYDLHTNTSLYSITAASGRQFNGTVDGSIAPYGFFPSSAGRSSAVIFIHKQSDAQKQAYRDKKSEVPKCLDSGSSGHVKYETHRARTVTAMLAAYAYNEYPVIIDLTDGVAHHLLQIRGNYLYVWETLSPQQAYYKQADVLKSLAGLLSEKKLRFTLEDIPEEMQGPVKKARSALRPVSGLREQLDSVVPLMPLEDRFECAHDIIASWVQVQPQAMPSSVMHFFE